MCHWPLIIAAISDEQSLIRRSAATALGKLRNDRAIPALIEQLSGPWKSQ
ncbi:MAG: HEAT repeat domain-containing protein [Anaerolineaceae bacterium]|nr:HEAT repeat domain-containing protein [Anaerolineaceae bacterium]